ncbi:serine/threonine-protein kinase [Stackebrandtia albiflava]|uniref:non-specific serine/threonine protein kinase n=1 Tax=Stackebrandtia albiflava TaxID=406432 RepID=A0A562VHD4_9ACTN|nr:serine/threonine protein kinase [Stackebrandtia albiflava]TWJ17194.1 serine/threonine-protein kinase [Stackebrandtia albiflava]
MLNAGDVLAGRYRLHGRVGGGGMGDVWKGEDTILGRTVAVKVLLTGLATDENFRERFRREACAIAALEAPGIVDVYDYGEVATPRGVVAFLIMQYVDGQALSRRIAGWGRLNTRDTLDIVAQVADALDIAHRAGVIHRDVKPGNILVRDDGRVTLVDFGIARASGDLTMTTTGVVLGTVTYMSPEQASGERLTAASDIYSLGVVAHQCLAGHPPFKADTPLGVLSAHLRNVPPSLPDDVSPDVAELISRALAKHPHDRWPTAAEFATACREARPAVTGRSATTRRAAVVEPPAHAVPEDRMSLREARWQPPAPSPVPAVPAVVPMRRRRRLMPGLLLFTGAAMLLAVVLVVVVGDPPWESRRLVDVTGTDASESVSPDGVSSPGDELPGGADEPVGNRSRDPSDDDPSTSPSRGGTGSPSPSPSESASSSPTATPVPDVVRQPEAKARQTLTEAGFHPAVTYQGDGGTTCAVTAQHPPAGDTAPPGSTVTITVDRAEVCAEGAR